MELSRGQLERLGDALDYIDPIQDFEALRGKVVGLTDRTDQSCFKTLR